MAEIFDTKTLLAVFGDDPRSYLAELFAGHDFGPQSMTGDCTDMNDTTKRPATAQPVPSDIPVPVTVNVKLDAVTNLIVSALEGGSSYWLRQYGYLHGDGREIDGGRVDGYEGPAYSVGEFWADGNRVRFTYDNPGEGEDLLTKDVGLAEIISGLNTMASKYGSHFSDVMTENDDAITADVFIQCVIFGEIIYG